MESYGTLPDGREVGLYTLVNSHGLRAKVTDFGAILVSMETPDRDGTLAPITLGFDTLEGWLKDDCYLGATVGRFGNRVRDGKFTVDGKEYTLATNNTPGGIPCHLHGGVVGFNKRLWDAQPSADGHSVTFTYLSPDGEEGYPGNLTARVTYTLTDDNELIWEAEATTDATTPLNMVHHTYWNLGGDLSTPILDHLLALDADTFLPTDSGLIPTGEKAPVDGTPMNFKEPRVIGERIEADFEPLHLAGGYDHCWVVNGEPGTLRPAARLSHPGSGRVMEVITDQPGIQFYAGNFLPNYRTGLCLETQNFPDAPNQPAFPDSLVRPGETYRHVMVHRFGVE
ncbi:aldose epimerase family protein [Luteolibacter sp. LG18]|uniref:aldose epimerase family protein n=1 Tax=Luteolibacter sp. LG18 TaxID=2819286 RepID=UPI0030C77350